MSLVLREAVNKDGGSYYSFDMYTFSIEDGFKNLYDALTCKRSNMNHSIDILSSGQKWLKAKGANVYIRVLRPYIFKKYVVEIWSNSKLYRIEKDKDSKDVFINGRVFLFEKALGSILMFGVRDGKVSFWLEGRTKVQKIPELLGELYPEPEDYYALLPKDDYSEPPDYVLKLDYSAIVKVDEFGIITSKGRLSWGTLIFRHSVVFKHKNKARSSILDIEMLCEIRSMLGSQFDILMCDNMYGFEDDNGFIVVHQLDGDGLYYHNRTEGKILFSIQDLVYEIDSVNSLSCDLPYLKQDLERDCTMLIKTYKDYYFCTNGGIFRIEGSNLVDAFTGGIVRQNCITDMTVGAMKRKYIIGGR